MTLIFMLMMLFGLLCVGQICYLSFFEGSLSMGKSPDCVDTTVPDWENNAPNDCRCFIRANSLLPERGEIRDDCGRLLVGNYTVFEVAFDGKKFANEYDKKNLYTKDSVDILLHNLAHSFYEQFKDRYPRSEREYYKLFKECYQQQRYKVVIFVKDWDEKSWVTGRDTSYIRNLPFLTRKVKDKKTEKVRNVRYFGYLNCVPTSVRVNPYGEMARRILGRNKGGHSYGLEYAMDSILAGKQGSKKFLELNKARVPLQDNLEPLDGMNIHTTINLDIQNTVHHELHRKLVELGAEWGCVIVMETKTGEIKAISNLRRASSDSQYYTESMEYALNANVEPGSTFKLASLLAFFEKGMTDSLKIYPIYNATFEYPLKNGSKRRYAKSDSKVHGPDTTYPNVIFQKSSNIGIASMIFKAYGIRNFASYRSQLAKFGMFDTVQTQLGPLMPASIRNDSGFDNYYGVCFGAGFTIPVIRTLMYYNAIANDGRMMKPLFVKYVTNNFDTVQTFESEVLIEKMVSDRTLKKARAYLDSVVWGRYGTGRRYRDSACLFAGKTGTRDLWDVKARKWIYDRNAVSFCGYFPKDNPQYTAIVYIYDIIPHSEVAVDLFGKIAKGIMIRQNYRALLPVEKFDRRPLQSMKPVNCRYYNALMSSLGYDTLAIHGGESYREICRDKNGADVRALSLKLQDGMPDVRNLIASDAVAELTRAGYKVSITGRGRVRTQTLDPATRIVKIHLEP